MTDVAVFGLGKLGLVWSLLLASKGYSVHGVDISHTVIQKLEDGLLPISEPGLEDLYEAGKTNFKPYRSAGELPDCITTIFIVVPTPSLCNSRFDSSFVEDCIDELVAVFLSRVFVDHIDIVVTSTVMPGTCKTLEDRLSEKIGRKGNWSLVYNPEFIALGSVLRDMLNPDFILIGASDPDASSRIEEIYKNVNGVNVITKKMSLVSAEIAKISVNTYLTSKISFANTIGLIAESFIDADAFAIADAVGSDTRIGKKYILPGLGFGGPCLPRDTRAFASLLGECGIPSDIPDAANHTNQYVLESKVNRVTHELSEASNGPILFLGITYKPGSWLLEDSHQFDIVQSICRQSQNKCLVFDYSAHDIKKFSKIYPLIKDKIRLDGNLSQLLADYSPSSIIYLSKLDLNEASLIHHYIEQEANNGNEVKEIDLISPCTTLPSEKISLDMPDQTIKEVSVLKPLIKDNLIDWYQSKVGCSLDQSHILADVDYTLSKANDQKTAVHNAIHSGYDNDRDQFLSVYTSLIHEVLSSHRSSVFNGLGKRIAVQAFPSVRVQLPGNLSVYEFHKDSFYSHPKNEINVFVALTDSFPSSSLQVQKKLRGKLSSFSSYSPLVLKSGQYAILDTSTTWHGDQPNLTDQTRVSIDFRIILDPSDLNGMVTHSGKKTISIGSYYSLFDVDNGCFLNT